MAKAQAKQKAKKPVKVMAHKRARALQVKRTQKKAPTPIVTPLPLEQTVDDYVAKVAPWQRAIIQKLRSIIRAAAPRAEELMKWSQPIYWHRGPFSYIKAHAAHVNLGFWRGTELDDPKRVLQGEGNRMRQVKITETQPLDELMLGALVNQAFKLNDKKGDPTKG